MALQYPARPNIPTYESSLAAFMPAFEAGQKARTDSNAFDAAAKAFGGGAGPAPQPASPLERLLGLGTPQQPQQAPAGPFTRPPVQSPPGVDEGAWETVATIPTKRNPASEAANAAANRPIDASTMSYMANARSAESGGNDAAANPNSSALGRYQFLESTWNGLMQKYPELGLTANGRTDGSQQERAMQRFTQDNAGALSSAGIPVDPGTLYAAHFLGAGGAQKALTADPGTPMTALVDPVVIQANPQLQGMTAGDFAQWAQQKGGNQSGGYQPPMQDVGGGQGKPFQIDEGTMRTLLASDATRPLAVSLIQAQQETQASQGRFVTEEGPDGAIWQRDTLTGQQTVLREPQSPSQRRIVQGPDGNSYYEDGSRVLPGVDARPEPGYRTLSPEEVQQQGLPPGAYQVGPDNKVSQIGSSGTNVTVNNGSEPALDKALNEAEGKQWAGYKSAGAVSASNGQDFEVLNELLALGPQGPITGRLADMFKGFNSAGDAANSIIKRIAPTLRVEGSGSSSDIEYQGMLDSLPSLINNPEANAMIISIMQAKAQINVERSQIVTAYQTGEMSVDEARRKMAELNSQSIMTPDMRRALIGLGGDGGITPAENQPITEGTVIENDNGEQMILRNGQWEPVL